VSACLVAHSTMDESQFRVVITALLTAFLAGYLTQSFAPQPPSQVSTSMLLSGLRSPHSLVAVAES
jgi:hypothetical protein